jgi:hypothetical protein
VEAVVAGWVAGYVMAVASTIVLTYLVLTMPREGWLNRWVAAEVPGMLLAVPLFTGAVLAWTMAGLILGAVYEVADLDGTRDGLGSPSLGFTLAMLALAWVPLPPLIAASRRRWWLWALLSALFAGLFGWLLPHLAGR